MNYLDWIVVGFIILGIISGFFRGFISQVFNVIGLVAGYLAARHFSVKFAGILSDLFPTIHSESVLIAFAVLFIAVLVTVKIISGLVEKAVDLAQLESVNKLLGALFGGIKYIIFLLILDIVLVNADLPKQEDLNQSKFYKLIRNQSNLVLRLVEMPKSVNDIIE